MVAGGTVAGGIVGGGGGGGGGVVEVVLGAMVVDVVEVVVVRRGRDVVVTSLESIAPSPGATTICAGAYRSGVTRRQGRCGIGSLLGMLT